MELFPNLPEEIGRDCLLRVPFKYHRNLRAVCKSWKAAVNSPTFYDDRKSVGMSEQRICLVEAAPHCGKRLPSDLASAYGVTTYDPTLNAWEPLQPPIPDGFPLFSNCICVNQKLVLIGGWNPHSWKETRAVWVYELSSCRWRRGADMPTLRSFCACAVSSRGLVYVAGGHDDGKNALRSAEVYDVEKDRWDVLPDMRGEQDECCGAFLDGKFYVISGYETQSQCRFRRSAEVFDPNTEKWTTLENMWSGEGSPLACVAAFGRLYSFEKDGVMAYNCEECAWRVVECRLPGGVTSVGCATSWRDKIFLCASQASGETVFYMFRPPAKGDSALQNWVAIERSESHAGFDQSAVSLDILMMRKTAVEPQTLECA